VRRLVEANEEAAILTAPLVQDTFDDDDFLLEKMIGKTNDIVSTEFLEFGLLAQRAVGRISTPTSFGTGFMVGNGLMLTNHHVLPTPDIADASTLDMDAEFNRLGTARPLQEYNFLPDRFWLTDKKHDITLVAVTDFTGERPDIDTFGWHILKAAQGKILMGEPINIIQHPSGKAKSLVVHNAHFLHLENNGDAQRFCWYTADTESGSSGSPVFNRTWDAVAIHHKAIPKTDKNGALLDLNGRQISAEVAKAQPERIAFVANEGIRASRVIEAIEAATLNAPMKEVRKDLLNLWDQPGAKQIALAKVKKSMFG